jgi:predicted amidophosphoribosyltransferase
MAESAPSLSLPRRWLAQARDVLASIVIPAPCLLCGALLTHSLRIPICYACLDRFARVPEKICSACGLPMADAAEVPGEFFSNVRRAGWKLMRSSERGVLRCMKSMRSARCCC